MKKKKILLFTCVAMILVSCGGKQGKPNFGDNEYAVRTITTQASDLETAYPQPLEVYKMLKFVRKFQDLLPSYVFKKDRVSRKDNYFL